MDKEGRQEALLHLPQVPCIRGRFFLHARAKPTHEANAGFIAFFHVAILLWVIALTRQAAKLKASICSFEIESDNNEERHERLSIGTLPWTQTHQRETSDRTHQLKAPQRGLPHLKKDIAEVCICLEACEKMNGMGFVRSFPLPPIWRWMLLKRNLTRIKRDKNQLEVQITNASAIRNATWFVKASSFSLNGLKLPPSPPCLPLFLREILETSILTIGEI